MYDILNLCQQSIGYIEGQQEANKIVSANFTLVKAPEIKEQEMKNIRKRSNGTFEGRITIDGKRYSVYARTQEECLKKLKKIKKSPNIVKSSQKLLDFALKWLEIYKKDEISQKSYNIYKNVIDNHLSKINISLNRLDILTLQQMINGLPKTRIKEYVYMTLKQILKKAYELDLIKKDISQFLKKGKIARRNRNGLSLNEQKTILNALSDCDAEFRVRIMCYFLIGCRPAEIKTLELRNEMDNYIYVGGTKTKNARRFVKISSNFREIFKSNKDIILSSSPEWLSKQFVRFCKELGINASLYTLRHTFATNLFYLGVPDKERQVYMGHASSVLTNDVYTDFDPNVKKEDIRELYGDLYPAF